MQISIKPICDWPVYLTALQMNDWLAISRLPFTPLHRLGIHFLQLWHKLELLAALYIHHIPQGHSTLPSFLLYSSSNLWLPALIFIVLPHIDFPHSLLLRSGHLYRVIPEANLLVALW